MINWYIKCDIQDSEGLLEDCSREQEQWRFTIKCYNKTKNDKTGKTTNDKKDYRKASWYK
jgi:hypothetical protein